jgi:azurin
MLADLNRPMTTKRNPFGKPIAEAREITLSAAKNLMFDQEQFRVNPGEVIRLTFKNPDAVPHNWALVEKNSLQEIGLLCNQQISDPQAAANQYIPDSSKVIAYTNIVEPFSEHTIYFRAPETPGRYPYLCTFPGHWMVMNGSMTVIDPSKD